MAWEVLHHPTYSPDLSLCNFYLFMHLKELIGGHKFEYNDMSSSISIISCGGFEKLLCTLVYKVCIMVDKENMELECDYVEKQRYQIPHNVVTRYKIKLYPEIYHTFLVPYPNLRPGFPLLHSLKN
jgi:hypothetical protein